MCPPPRTKGGVVQTRRAVRGWGVNISEDARHWNGLLQYNPSTERALLTLQGHERVNSPGGKLRSSPVFPTCSLLQTGQFPRGETTLLTSISHLLPSTDRSVPPTKMHTVHEECSLVCILDILCYLLIILGFKFCQYHGTYMFTDHKFLYGQYPLAHARGLQRDVFYLG